MSRPSFFSGVGIAFVLALAGTLAAALVLPWIGATEGLRILATGLTLGYLLYLFRLARASVGHITALLLWFLSTCLLWWVAAPLGVFVLAQAGFLWAIRCFYFHSSVFGALADAVVTGMGLMAAAATLGHSESLGLSIWAFFLIQGLFTYIPNRPFRKRSERFEEQDAFLRARRTAEEALRRLSLNSQN